MPKWLAVLVASGHSLFARQSLIRKNRMEPRFAGLVDWAGVSEGDENVEFRTLLGSSTEARWAARWPLLLWSGDHRRVLPGVVSGAAAAAQECTVLRDCCRRRTRRSA